jgi:hypothetical protein
VANQVNKLFSSQLVVANIGLEIFASACADQHTQCVHVDWKPEAGGNRQIADLLAKLKNK